MSTRISRSAVLTALTAVMALFLLSAAPAFAGNHDTRSEGRSENAQQNGGNSGSRPQPGGGGGGGSETTEDNDGDGLDNQGRDGNGNGTYPNPSQHPSGKDRYDEPGGSGNQGKSQSDPDGMENGGADKPGGSGGEDPYDQDGNNGCGNDQDFEDDNNGWCGRNPKRNDRDESEIEDAGLVTVRSCPDGSMVPVNEDCVIGTTPELDDTEVDFVELDHNLALRGAEDDVNKVLGIKIARELRPAAPEILGLRLSPALTSPLVLGGAVLPFTGGQLLVFVAVALGLVAVGASAIKLGRKES